MLEWNTEKFRAKKLVDLVKAGTIQIPPYQRGQVWSATKERLFIDSLTKGYPFGSLLLYKKGDSSIHLIDGLQRATTLSRFIENPAEYIDQNEITENTLETIVQLIAAGGDQNSIKEKVRDIVSAWIKTHKDFESLSGIQYYDGATLLKNSFPLLVTKVDQVIEALKPDITSFTERCKDVIEAEIPVLVYSGDPSNLPTIFQRINEAGVKLTKYQILAASWSEITIRVGDEFDDILSAVMGFFDKLEIDSFKVVGYDRNVFFKERRVNLYQLIFGFSKLLKKRYPALFGKDRKSLEVESCGFALLNACFGNKNNQLESLKESFVSLQTDEIRNSFLHKVLDACNQVDKVVGGVNEFKLNSRGRPNVLHTELQICSMIASVFLAKYSRVDIAGERAIVHGFGTQQPKSKQYIEQFKKNALARYTSDVINNRWGAHGDSRLDEIIFQEKYYTEPISREAMQNDLLHWFTQQKSERRENSKITSPQAPEKLVLSLIYYNALSAKRILDRSSYDIEHLAPKEQMRIRLNGFNSEMLPLSSIANLSLLPQYNNRSKGAKTLYQDTQYLNKLDNTLGEIEKEFTFTIKSDLDWLSQEFEVFEDFEKCYINFLDTRFDRMLTKTLVALGYK